MQKVLIYGFGWSGQSMLELCLKLGFECKVVDDSLNLSFTKNDVFMDFQAIPSFAFDIYFICCVQEEVRHRILEKLLGQNIPKEKIKFIHTYVYKPQMSFLVKEYFSNAQEVLQEWLGESQDMPDFHQKLQTMQEAYFQKKAISSESLWKWREEVDEAIPNQTIFSKIYLSTFVKSRLDHIAYPGFSVGISMYKREDKDFYFVKKIDFDALIHRPKHIKLIACFGNSALRVEYLPYKESITAFLQKEVGDSYIVLNFGVTGYTIYEQLMLYNALCFELKPELVLSFFLGTDFRTGLISCDILVKKHKILYGPWWAEGDYKKTIQSEMPLFSEMGNNPQAVNNNITFSDINAAIKMRLEQFRAIVSAGGGGISCLYPTPIALQVRMERRRKSYAA
ncbi:SGNH/GDSL hydrolase family protein [Helicobacter mesocricetorum]|uniref:hypothetical protein n=1 Tax=Helicobacter mesocricetorum TaxID=87012 RepID=UPI000CF01E90|nr:hypothetical protein [Helicobacter mesocricetorum]